MFRRCLCSILMLCEELWLGKIIWFSAPPCVAWPKRYEAFWLHYFNFRHDFHGWNGWKPQSHSEKKTQKYVLQGWATWGHAPAHYFAVNIFQKKGDDTFCYIIRKNLIPLISLGELLSEMSIKFGNISVPNS